MSPWKSSLAVALAVLFAHSVAAAQPAAEPPTQEAAQNSPPPAPPSVPADTIGATSGQGITPGEVGEADRWSGEAAGYPIENVPSRSSGFWTSRRPAKGGAYRYRLLGIGVVLLIATLLLMIRVVRRYERPESP